MRNGTLHSLVNMLERVVLEEGRDEWRCRLENGGGC